MLALLQPMSWTRSTPGLKTCNLRQVPNVLCLLVCHFPARSTPFLVLHLAHSNSMPYSQCLPEHDDFRHRLHSPKRELFGGNNWIFHLYVPSISHTWGSLDKCLVDEQMELQIPIKHLGNWLLCWALPSRHAIDSIILSIPECTHSLPAIWTLPKALPGTECCKHSPEKAGATAHHSDACFQSVKAARGHHDKTLPQQDEKVHRSEN